MPFKPSCPSVHSFRALDLETCCTKQAPQAATVPISRYTFPMFDARVLEGQTAIVTGGGTGIGLAIALALGKHGARVVIASRGAEHLEAGTAALRDAGCEVVAVPVDVRQPDAVDAMVARTLDRVRPDRHPRQQRRGKFHLPRRRSHAERLECRHRHRAERKLLLLARGRPPHDRAGRRRIDRLDPGQLRVVGQRRDHSLGVGESRRDGDDADACGRNGPPIGFA